MAAPFAFSQEKANFPLESIKIVGNEAIPTERILAATGLKIGAPITRPEFNEARDRLVATGAFESVAFEYKGSAKDTGFDATFRVTETSPLYKFRFEELPGTEASLREALSKQEPIFTDAIPPTPQVMNRYSSALAKFLNSGTQVIGEVNSDTGEPMIVFRPMGARLNISEVNFTGNVAMDQVALWKAINPVAIGVPFSEPFFRQLLGSVVSAYEEHGRIRVTFPKVETKKSEDNDGIDVMVTVDEGAVYKLGDVTFKGVASREAPELNKLGNWSKNAVVNFAEIDSGIRRIQKSFREDGYLRVETPIVREVHDDTKTVDLVITIQPGPVFTMGKLTIKGLDIISEPAIRKVWKLNEGDHYKESYPDTFLAMIRSEGYFDNLARTGAEAVLHEDSHKVDVILSFLGAKAAADADKKLR